MLPYSESLHTTLDISINPAAIVALSGEVLFVNKSFKPILQSIGINNGYHFNADDLDMRAASFGKSFSWAEIIQFEHEKDGFTMNIHIQDDPNKAYKCRVGKFAGNTNDFYLLILTDITPQWVLEKKIALKDSQTDRIISEFPTVICGLDIEGFIKVWNHRAMELTGYSALEMIDNPEALSMLFPNQRYRYEVLQKWNTRDENVIRFWNMDITCKDGSIKTLSWTVRYRENPIIPGIYHWAIGVDVSAEVNALKALRESEERFHIIARATNDAVWDYDIVKDQLWWSDGLKDLFGYDPAKIENTLEWWENQIHPDYRKNVVQRFKDFIVRGETYWSDEYLFRKQDGEYAYIYDKGNIIKNEKGQPVRFIGGMSDLTDEKAFETLAKMREEQLNQYIAAGSQKLRPPLSRVMQIAKLLAIMKHDRKEVKELADQLVRSTHELEMAVAGGMEDEDDD
ncbi:MAG: PAS domain-containing protein [Flavobacteriales bacterium]